jgi:transposase
MDMTMSSATPTRVEVVTSVQRRRRWTPEQKLEIVKQTNEPGSSFSIVPRQFGITGGQLLRYSAVRSFETRARRGRLLNASFSSE